jgi:hypothetical protein
MDEPEISPAQNALNAILMVAVALPAVYAGSLVTTDCFANASGLYTGPLTNLNDTTNAFCRLGLNHPIAFVNLVFFLNVCVLFWIISLLQGSTWLIGELVLYIHNHSSVDSATYAFPRTMANDRLTHSVLSQIPTGPSFLLSSLCSIISIRRRRQSLPALLPSLS